MFQCIRFALPEHIDCASLFGNMVDLMRTIQLCEKGTKSNQYSIEAIWRVFRRIVKLTLFLWLTMAPLYTLCQW